MGRILTELLRRKVFHVVGVYVVVSWVLLQVAATLEETARLPEWVDIVVLVLLVLGLPLAIILAWAQETQAATDDEAIADEDATPPVAADRPSIAVLPFDNMSDESEFAWLADGMTEEIIMLLAKSPDLLVTARNSSFAYKNQSPDVRTVGRELGVRYVLEGSLRKAGDRIRATVQLIETTSGAHVWAEKYDQPLEKIFDLQDEVCIAIARVLEAEIMVSEIARVTKQKPDSLDAWGEFVVGRAKFLERGKAHQEAVLHLRRAVKLDPDFARAHSSLAVCLGARITNGMTNDPEAEHAEALALVERSRKLAPDDFYVLTQCANTMIHLGHAADALELHTRVRDMEPSWVHGHAGIGYASVALGKASDAVAALDVAIELSPKDSNLYNWYLWKAQAELIVDQPDKAARHARAALDRNPENDIGWQLLANSLALLGRTEEAQAAFDRLLEVVPNFSVDAARTRWHEFYVDAANGDKMVAGLETI